MSNEDNNNIQNKNLNIKILYPKPNIYHMFDNKIVFTKIMLSQFPNNIPKVYYLEYKIYDNHIKFPLISKPEYSTCGNNMKILRNKYGLINSNKLLIQQYIVDKYEYGAFMLCIDGEIINYKIIREQFKTNKYYIKRKNFNNYEEIKDFDIDLFKKIIKLYDYSGGICINFKYINSIIYIFEINPRFGGSAFSKNFFYELICIKNE